MKISCSSFAILRLKYYIIVLLERARVYVYCVPAEMIQDVAR